MLNTKLIAALVLATVGGAAQAQMPSSIAFDGYCDGITGITSLGSGVFTGTHDYTVCNQNGGNYTNTPMVGPSGRRMVKSSGNGIAGTDSSYAQFGASFVYVANDDGTWYLFAPEFGGLVNLGTWSEGYPGNAARSLSSKPSFQK
jgi:hypothetical protein